MSDYVDIHIAMTLKPDAPDDLAEQVMELVGRKGRMHTDHAERVSLGESIHIPSITLPDGVDGAVVIDGRLYVDAQSCNAQRPREWLGERTQLLALVELLDQFCAEPLGAIVGAAAGDWSMDDAGPMIVTGQGIAIFSGDHDRRNVDYGWGTVPERITVTSISPDVAARLERGSEPGWGGGWGELCKDDITEIVAWTKAQPQPEA